MHVWRVQVITEKVRSRRPAWRIETYPKHDTWDCQSELPSGTARDGANWGRPSGEAVRPGSPRQVVSGY